MSAKLVYFLVSIAIILRLSDCGVLSAYEERKYGKQPEETGLYNDEDKVDVLISGDFKRKVFNQNHATIVEFYNSWCGFCQKFAPVWKELADDLERWRPVVQIAAINCAEERNTQICREFEIMAYPSLRLFPINYTEGTGIIVQKTHDVPSLRETVVRELRSLHSESKGAPQWPDLGYYDKSDVGQLWDKLSNDIKYVFIVFQEDNSTTVGHELALDLLDIGHINIRTTLDESNLGNVLKIEERPAVAVLSRNAQDSVIKLSPAKPNRDEIRKSVEVFLKSHQIKVHPETHNKTGHWRDLEIPDSKQMLNNMMIEALQRKVKSLGDAVFQSDLESAVRYSIFQEIPKQTNIEAERLVALQQFVSVLAKYLRMGPSGKAFLNVLDDSLQRVTEINGQDFYALVKTLEEGRTVFSTHQWLGCKGSKPGLRGYPCGMWTLFHHLTVQAAEDHSTENPTAKGQEILQAMHGYIKNFFGCADCSNHFQEMAAQRGIWNVVGGDEAILWLWAAHNQVNKRLAGDLSEDPEHKKIQFPSFERCPDCYKSKGGEWQYFKVLEYIKHLHNPSNVSLLDVDLSNFIEPKPMFSAATITKLDFNICILMYGLCGTLIFVAIKMILKKKYKKKAYPYDVLGKI